MNLDPCTQESNLRVAVPTPRGETFFLWGWVQPHVGYQERTDLKI